ncbi:hypothetical protein BDV38DRAFT_149778 [Aspergillus pseudotamarii]|uniref:Uncharacterized protein n=1 Tax=Aspergillus pseudotamarii TaxID=132259 RepID=A0A5N6T6X4_ASPPS|nr:uncharacterized protein BDV38DRAFT_149778 [Aspergillus pseudotamarii]KAE8142083.1 hypothetical protein BDV38DRAFT_149778 [Aspergillus pseudotamarii]
MIRGDPAVHESLVCSVNAFIIRQTATNFCFLCLSFFPFVHRLSSLTTSRRIVISTLLMHFATLRSQPLVHQFDTLFFQHRARSVILPSTSSYW